MSKFTNFSVKCVFLYISQYPLQVNGNRAFAALHCNNLKLSLPKTLIARISAVTLGWLWKQGTLTATPHRVSTLATCVQPKTVKGLRSFLWAYKFLSRILPQISSILAPLEEAIAGIASVTDGAQKLPGIKAAILITRGSKRHISGHYSAKLHIRQLGWIPCEIEALTMTASVSHFCPYIIQSKLQTCILTDSKPCVDAFAKLCRGEFSLSSRVMTYLSTVSQYQCDVKHVSGSDNMF